MSQWSETAIATALAKQVFDRKHLVIVPNCSWPGSECDLLVVTPNLRVIDVEIKISRADLKADVVKEKWFHSWDWRKDGPWTAENRRRRDWPHRVWKHYYALPAEVWHDDILMMLSPASGVLLLRHKPDRPGIFAAVRRMAKPCRDAERITAEDAIDIARLASLRMWDAYDRIDRMRDDARRAA